MRTALQIRSPQSEARLIQFGIAAVFLMLGAWCLIAPQNVIDLSVREAHRDQSTLLSVSVAAFGAQAMLAGLLAGAARFTNTTFLCLGLSIIPFFVFDWWFYSIDPLFNEFILLDAAGNLAFIALCARGYFLTKQQQ